MDRDEIDILRQLLLDENQLVAPKPSQPSGPSDHWTLAVLLERAAYLRQMARHGDGSAGETLKEYASHSAQLSVRSRSGVAELHEKFADVFYVLDGCATLVTGGSIANSNHVAPGDLRCDAVQGGVRQPLRSGDVAHVPANVPHQMLLDGDNTLTCMVFKIQETD